MGLNFKDIKLTLKEHIVIASFAGILAVSLLILSFFLANIMDIYQVGQGRASATSTKETTLMDVISGADNNTENQKSMEDSDLSGLNNKDSFAQSLKGSDDNTNAKSQDADSTNDTNTNSDLDDKFDEAGSALMSSSSLNNDSPLGASYNSPSVKDKYNIRSVERETGVDNSKFKVNWVDTGSNNKSQIVKSATVHYGYVDERGVYHIDALSGHQSYDLKRDVTSTDHLKSRDNADLWGLFDSNLNIKSYSDVIEDDGNYYSYGGSFIGGSGDGNYAVELSKLALTSTTDSYATTYHWTYLNEMKDNGYKIKGKFGYSPEITTEWTQDSSSASNTDVYIVYKKNANKLKVTFIADLLTFHYGVGYKDNMYTNQTKKEVNVEFYTKDERGRDVPFPAPYATDLEIESPATDRNTNGYTRPQSEAAISLHLQDYMGRSVSYKGEDYVYSSMTSNLSSKNFTAVSYNGKKFADNKEYDVNSFKQNLSINQLEENDLGVDPKYWNFTDVSGSGSSWTNYTIKLYFSKEKAIDTLDTASRGIKLDFFDYESYRDYKTNLFNYSINKNVSFRSNGACYYNDTINGYYNSGNLRLGIMKSYIGDNSSPHDYSKYNLALTDWYKTDKDYSSHANPIGNNLSYLIKDGSDADGYKHYYTNLNHLFPSKTYEETGYYEFDSLYNFAQLKRQAVKPEDIDDDSITSDFVVYDTPQAKFSNDNPYFMPLDDKNSLWSPTGGDYFQDGQHMFSRTDMSPNSNFLWGLSMNIDFVQPLHGQAKWKDKNEDLVFEFTGDDDVYVYVNNVLVLDIGGIHSSRGGSINFATGEVNYVEETKYNTTIYDMFVKAGMQNLVEWEDSIVKPGNKTLKTNSRNDLKFFYFERGAYASNCKLKFNLTTKGKRDLEVGKQYKNGIEPNIKNPEETLFHYYLQKKSSVYDDKYEDYVGNVTIYQGVVGDHGDVPLRTETVDHGQLTLAANEVAVIDNFYAEDYYQYVEYYPDSDIGIHQKYNAQDIASELMVQEITDDEGDDYSGFGKLDERVDYNAYATNIYNDVHAYDLKINDVTQPEGKDKKPIRTDINLYTQADKEDTDLTLQYKGPYEIHDLITGDLLKEYSYDANRRYISVQSGQYILIPKVEQGAKFRTDIIKSYQYNDREGWREWRDAASLYPGDPLRIDYDRTKEFAGTGSIYKYKQDSLESKDSHSEYNIQVVNKNQISKGLKIKKNVRDHSNDNVFNPDEEFHYLVLYQKTEHDTPNPLNNFECRYFKNDGTITEPRNSKIMDGKISLKAGEMAILDVGKRDAQGSYTVIEYIPGQNIQDKWEVYINDDAEPIEDTISYDSITGFGRVFDCHEDNKLFDCIFFNDKKPYSLRIGNVSDASIPDTQKSAKIKLSLNGAPYYGPYSRWYYDEEGVPRKIIAYNGWVYDTGQSITDPWMQFNQGEFIQIENINQGTPFSVDVKYGDDTHSIWHHDYMPETTNIVIEDWIRDATGTGSISNNMSDKDYSEFNVKISNEVAPANTNVKIKKTVSGSAALTSSSTDDKLYNFYIKYNESAYNGPCKISSPTDSRGDIEISGGLLSLKADETATIPELEIGKNFSFVEYLSPDADKILDKWDVSINGVAQTIPLMTIDGYTGVGVETVVQDTAAQNTYTVNNNLNDYDLKIRDYSSDRGGESSQVRLYYKQDDNYIPYEGTYYTFSDHTETVDMLTKSTEDGIIYIPEGGTAEIKSVEQGLEFKTEIVKYKWFDYEFPDGIDPIEGVNYRINLEGTAERSDNVLSAKIKNNKSDLNESVVSVRLTNKSYKVSKLISATSTVNPAVRSTQDYDDYSYLVYTNDFDNPTDLIPYSGIVEIYYRNSILKSKTSISDGQISLLNGEYAVFKDLSQGNDVKVIEYIKNPDDRIIDKWVVQVNGSPAEEVDSFEIGDLTYTGFGYTDKVSESSTENVAAFENDLYLYDFVLNNVGTNILSDNIYAQIKFNNNTYQGVYYIIKDEVVSEAKNVDGTGKIKFSCDESILIKNIEQNTAVDVSIEDLTSPNRAQFQNEKNIIVDTSIEIPLNSFSGITWPSKDPYFGDLRISSVDVLIKTKTDLSIKKQVVNERDPLSYNITATIGYKGSEYVSYDIFDAQIIKNGGSTVDLDACINVSDRIGQIMVKPKGSSQDYKIPSLANGDILTVSHIFELADEFSLKVLEERVDGCDASIKINDGIEEDMDKDKNYFYTEYSSDELAEIENNIEVVNTFKVRKPLEIGKTLVSVPQTLMPESQKYTFYLGVKKSGTDNFVDYNGEYRIYNGQVGNHKSEIYTVDTAENGIIKIEKDKVAWISTIEEGDQFMVFEYIDGIADIDTKWEISAKDINKDDLDLKDLSAPSGSAAGEIKGKGFQGDIIGDNYGIQFTNDLSLFKYQIKDIGTNDASQNLAAKVTFAGSLYTGNYHIIYPDGNESEQKKIGSDGVINFKSRETISIDGVEQGLDVKTEIVNLAEPSFATFSNPLNLDKSEYDKNNYKGTIVNEKRTPNRSYIEVEANEISDLSLNKVVSGTVPSEEDERLFNLTFKIQKDDSPFISESEFDVDLPNGSTTKAKTNDEGIVLFKGEDDAYSIPSLMKNQSFTIKSLFMTDQNYSFQVLEEQVKPYVASISLNAGESSRLTETTKIGEKTYYVSGWYNCTDGHFTGTDNTFYLTNKYVNRTIEIGKSLTNEPQVKTEDPQYYNFYLGTKKSDETNYSDYVGEYSVGSDTKSTDDGVIKIESDQIASIDILDEGVELEVIEFIPDVDDISSRWSVSAKDKDGSSVTLNTLTAHSGDIIGLGRAGITIPEDEGIYNIEFVNDLNLYSYRINNVGTNHASQELTAQIYFDNELFNTGKYWILEEGKEDLEYTVAADGKINFNSKQSILIEDIEQGVNIKTNIINLDKPDYSLFKNANNILNPVYSKNDEFTGQIPFGKPISLFALTGNSYVSSVDVEAFEYSDFVLEKIVTGKESAAENFTLTARVKKDDSIVTGNTYKAYYSNASSTEIDAKLDDSGMIVLKNTDGSYSYPSLADGVNLTVKDMFLSHENYSFELLELEVRNYQPSSKLNESSSDAFAYTEKIGSDTFNVSKAYKAPDVVFNEDINTFTITNTFISKYFEIGKELATDTNFPQIKKTEDQSFCFFLGVDYKGAEGSYTPYSGMYYVYDGAVGETHVGTGDERTSSNGLISIEAGQVAVIKDMESSDKFECFEYLKDTTKEIDKKYNVSAKNQLGDKISLKNISKSGHAGLGTDGQQIQEDKLSAGVQFINDLCLYNLKINNIAIGDYADDIQVKVEFEGKTFNSTNYPGTKYYIYTGSNPEEYDVPTGEGFISVDRNQYIFIPDIEQGVNVKITSYKDDEIIVLYKNSTNFASDPDLSVDNVLKAAVPDLKPNPKDDNICSTDLNLKLAARQLKISKEITPDSIANTYVYSNQKDYLYNFHISVNGTENYRGNCDIYGPKDPEHPEGESTLIDKIDVKDGRIHLKADYYAILTDLQMFDTYSVIEYLDGKNIWDKWDVSANGQPLSDPIEILGDKGLGFSDISIDSLSFVDFVNNLNLYDLDIKYNKPDDPKDNVLISIIISFEDNPYNGKLIIKNEDGTTDEVDVKDGKIKIEPGQEIVIDNLLQDTELKVAIDTSDPHMIIKFPDIIRINDPIINNNIFTGKIQDMKELADKFSFLSISVSISEDPIPPTPTPTPAPGPSSSIPKTIDFVEGFILFAALFTLLGISSFIYLRYRKRKNH